MGLADSAAVPPGYKQTEVGVIPEDWDFTPIGKIASFSSGVGISVSALQQKSPDTSVPVFGGNGVAGFTGKPLIDKPTVVVGRVGQKCGEVYLTQGPAWITDNALYPRSFFRRIHTPFFALAMQAAGLNNVRNRNDLPLVTQSILHSVNLALPTSELEQQAIAEALSDADALIEGLEALITKKHRLRQGVFSQLFKEQKEWAQKKLGDICNIEIGRTPARRNTAFWGKGHQWLSIADLKTKYVCKSKEEITDLAAAEMQMVRAGTLLMSFKLSIGRLCFAGCDLYTNEAICSFNQPRAKVDFLYYVLGQLDFSLYGKQAVKGYTLNKASLRDVPVPLPEEQEQVRIATILSDMDAEIDVLEGKLAKARRVKAGMMQDLLTGRVRLI